MNARDNTTLAKPATTPHCDCTVRCGDDPWLKTGEAQPCNAMLASQEHDRILSQQVALISQLRKTYDADSVITLLEKMHAEIVRLQALAVPVDAHLPVALVTDDTFAELGYKFGLHLHTLGSGTQEKAMVKFARAVLELKS